jgi:hypothetical protein
MGGQAMRQKRMGIVLVMIFSSLIFCSLVYAAPKIACENPLWEFKKVKEGVKVEHAYRIKNVGDETLEIERVRASCGCTAASPVSKTIKPGEETDVLTSFDTANRAGKQTKYIYVHCNDPDNKMFKLTISGEVEEVPSPKIIIRPPSWNIQTLEPGKTQRTTIVIQNTGKIPLEINSVIPSNTTINVILTSTTIEAGGKADMEISFLPDMAAPTIREKITLETNDPKRKTLDFNIFGRMDLESLGFTLSVTGATPVAENMQINLYLKNSQPYPITLKIPDALEPNVVTVSPKNIHSFSITIPKEKMTAPEPSGDNIIYQGAYNNLKVELTVPVPDPTKAGSSAVAPQGQKGVLQVKNPPGGVETILPVGVRSLPQPGSEKQGNSP